VSDNTQWSAIIGAGGAILGFVVSRWITVAESRARSHARLQALRAEILECAARAEHLRHVDANSIIGYSLPDWIGRDTVGALAADGFFNESDAQVLVRFYALVADANRNLHYAASSSSADLSDVFGMINAGGSASSLFAERGGVSLVRQAEAVVTHAIDDVAKWKWWHPFFARRH
jgi:hypothetical protein